MLELSFYCNDAEDNEVWEEEGPIDWEVENFTGGTEETQDQGKAGDLPEAEFAHRSDKRTSILWEVIIRKLGQVLDDHHFVVFLIFFGVGDSEGGKKLDCLLKDVQTGDVAYDVISAYFCYSDQIEC